MPPKKQITREQIIDKAFELAKEKGFEKITVRVLASELHCSTQPIYLSFKDMNELKKTIAEKSINYMLMYIDKYAKDNYSPLVSRLLGYVQFASEEKYLYQLIFSSEIMNQEKLVSLVPIHDKLDLNMLIYAHGIIMMNTFGSLTMKWEQIKELILDAYTSFQ